MSDLLPTSEVARLGGVSPATVTREVVRGNLCPAYQLPGPAGALLFSPDEVKRWVNARSAKESA